MTGHPITVTVYFASFNTVHVSELCLRSMRALAGHPFDLVVGDCDSTDGSIEMLQNYSSRGQCALEIARGGRPHGVWLDHWLATATSRYLVFCDSDVEFLRPNWLDELVQAAHTSNAALVCTRIQAKGGVLYTHPKTGAMATLAPRPEPWLMLIDVEAARKLNASFMYEEHTLPDGTKVAYDTGAAFFRELKRAGLRYVEMPPQFSKSLRHYSGMTWQGRDMPLRRQAKQLAKHIAVRVRLLRSRFVHRRALRLQN